MTLPAGARSGLGNLPETSPTTKGFPYPTICH